MSFGRNSSTAYAILAIAALVGILAVVIMVLAVVRARRPLFVACAMLPGLVLVAGCIAFLVYSVVRPLFVL